MAILESEKKYAYSEVKQQLNNDEDNSKELSQECKKPVFTQNDDEKDFLHAEGPNSKPLEIEKQGERDRVFVRSIDSTIGTRHVQVCLHFMLGFMAFAFRVSLSVGIVAMTDPSVSSNPNIPTYPSWKKKNVILSAFFWGYVVLQVFAAWSAKKYGAKWFLVGTMFIQSILSILTPVTAATFGEEGIIASRAIEGLCQGFVFPACTHILSQWVPVDERSRFGSVIFTSGKLGTLFSMAMSGFIAASSYGWPWIFRLLGGIGLVWCLLMSVFGYDGPRDHPKITQAEKFYIEQSLGHDGKIHKTPWRAIFTSVPVWALFIAQLGQTYCFWTLLTQIPSYMNYVIKFNIKNNGVMSAIPYLNMFILSFVFGFISDTVINRGIISRSTSRKIFNTIGFFAAAIALVILGFTRADQRIQAIILLNIAVGVNSAALSGYAVNHMDLSPNHAGMIMGFINGTTQISGIIAPLVVQIIVTNPEDALQWRYVFFIASGCYISSAIVFIIFASAKVQWWNKEQKEDKA